jgi:hypothetical protein
MKAPYKKKQKAHKKKTESTKNKTHQKTERIKKNSSWSSRLAAVLPYSI